MTELETAGYRGGDLLPLASRIVTAYVSTNSVPVADLPAMIRSVHAALLAIAAGPSSEPSTNQRPAVPIKKSITPDYIISLEDGKRLKMLKRYLRSNFDMTPESYRAKWGLAHDYPMVAPNYSAKRSEFAKSIGLGRTKSSASPKRRRRGH